jgi:radical SAM superfamily enzyme YgiQ (UPF0313 family)
MAVPPVQASRLLLAGKILRNMTFYARTGILPREGRAFTRGLLTMASSLAQAGHTPRYMAFYRGREEELAHHARWAEIIAVSSVTPQQNTAEHVYRLVRAEHPQVLVVAGGYHPTALPEDTLHLNPELDCVIMGEGERTLVELASRGTGVGVDGCAWRQDHSVRLGKARTPLPGSDFPFPAYGLLPGHLEAYDFNVSTTRGCGHQCTFCANGSFWGKMRAAPVSAVADEIQFLAPHLLEGTLVHFTDNAFTASRERTRQICARLVVLGAGLKFSCDICPGSVDDELVGELAGAGFVHFGIGFEDSTPAVLRRAGKGASLGEAEQTAKIIKRHPGLAVTAYWMVGLPGSTPATQLNAIEYARRLIVDEVVDIVSPRIFVPYPGTAVFSQPERYGLEIIHRHWAEYDRVAARPVYQLATMTRDEVRHLYWHMRETLNEAYRIRLELDAVHVSDAVDRAEAAGVWAYS